MIQATSPSRPNAPLRTLAAPLAALSIAALVAVGCGGRPPVGTGADSGGPQRDSSPTADARIAPDATPPSKPGACIIAVRFGSCCATIETVSAAELAADRCLLRWPAARPTKECPQLCNAVCPPPPPPSRVAERAADGTCRFVDECRSEKDCRVGYNQFSCCDCGNVYPVAFLAQHPCYNGDGDNCGEKCPAGGPICDCAAPPWPPTCVLGTAPGQYNHCAYDASGQP